MSSADILTALYFRYLSIHPAEPSWPGRDRFILSIGHITPVLMPLLPKPGYFPKGRIAHSQEDREPIARTSPGGITNCQGLSFRQDPWARDFRLPWNGDRREN